MRIKATSTSRKRHTGRRSWSKQFLCDIDGILVDSNHLHAKAWQDAFAVMGIEVGFEQALHQIGKGGDQLMPVFVPDWKLPAVVKPFEAYHKFIFL